MKNKFRINGDTTIIETYYKGEVMEYLIDTEDLERVHNFSTGTWHPLGHKKPRYQYAQISVNYKSTLLHRLIMNAPADMVVDHKNHNPRDNRKQNLQVVTHAENLQNRHYGDTHSKISYIYREKRGERMLWVVRIPENGVRKNLGRFSSLSEAKTVLDDYLSTKIY